MESLETAMREQMEKAWREEWTLLAPDWQDILVKDLEYMWREEGWSAKGGVPSMIKVYKGRIFKGKLRTYVAQVRHYYE